MSDSKAKAPIEAAQFTSRLDAALEKNDGAALASLAEFDLTKAQRKQLKRAAHRLRSAGVQVELPAETKARARPSETGPQVECLATSIDGNGGRMLWLFADAAEGGREAVAVYLDDTDGLKLIQLAAGGRKKSGEIKRGLLRSKDVPVAQLEGAHARAIIEEAETLTRERGHALPEGFAALHEQVRKLPEASALSPHPAEELVIDLGERELAGFIRDSATLLEAHPFRGWGPDAELGKLLSGRIEQVLTSSVIVTPAQRLEQLERTFQDAALEQMQGSIRSRWVRRLRDAALVLHRRGDKELGEKTATLAGALETHDEPPAFLVSLLRRPYEQLFTQQRNEQIRGSTGAGVNPDSKEEGENPAQPAKGKLIIPGR